MVPFIPGGINKRQYAPSIPFAQFNPPHFGASYLKIWTSSQRNAVWIVACWNMFCGKKLFDFCSFTVYYGSWLPAVLMVSVFCKDYEYVFCYVFHSNCTRSFEVLHFGGPRLFVLHWARAQWPQLIPHQTTSLTALARLETTLPGRRWLRGWRVHVPRLDPSRCISDTLQIWSAKNVFRGTQREEDSEWVDASQNLDCKKMLKY